MAIGTIGGIIIEPNGVEVVVDITLGGSNPTAYTTAGGPTTHTFPVTASERTEFHFVVPGSMVVSVKRNGVEIAGGAGDTRTIEVAPGQVTAFSPGVEVGTEASAQEATLVHLAGAETITGDKTFSGDVQFSGDSQAEHIADPTGAATDTDDEARAAIGLILDLLEARGLMAEAE